jgi:nucleotide-binding universal stress UspA family protein
MEEIKRILVAAKDTKQCKNAFEFGVSLAKKYEAELFVLHAVYNPFGLKGLNILTPSKNLEDEYIQYKNDLKSALDNMIQAPQASGLDVQVSLIEGKPDKEIIEFVKEKRIDLLIMSHHEEGHLEHILFDQLTYEITRKMPCSVMLVKERLEWE